jgi:hypothetical protein
MEEHACAKSYSQTHPQTHFIVPGAAYNPANYEWILSCPQDVEVRIGV